MIRDFAESDLSGNYDFCVIGSGPAGITIALKLATANRRVLLLEGGGEQYSAQSQATYKGTVSGDPYFPLESARLRYFGGTSNHWGGWVRQLDHYDFLPKPYHSRAGWPLRKTDLDPYFNDVKEILGIDQFPPDRRLDDYVQEIGFEFKPIRFAEKYRDAIDQSENLEMWLNANVTRIRTDGARVEALDVVNWQGREFSATADKYILATGGIENSRLLLWSDRLANGGLLPKGSPIGRYWMEHPHFAIGQALIFDDNPFRSLHRANISFFSPTERAMSEGRALNCGLRLVPVNYVGKTKLVAELACVAPRLADALAQQLGRRLICGSRLEAAWEQEPRSANRIELSDELDSFGIPRVTLHWTKTRYDIRTARIAATRLGEYLATNDIGRIHLDDWVANETEFPTDGYIGGYHHMGGTRMSDSTADGVVDRDCKVFGQDNLYITGSSVFPSGGHANPTFAILQLALRLGEHLLGESRSAVSRAQGGPADIGQLELSAIEF